MVQPVIWFKHFYHLVGEMVIPREALYERFAVRFTPLRDRPGILLLTILDSRVGPKLQLLAEVNDVGWYWRCGKECLSSCRQALKNYTRFRKRIVRFRVFYREYE